MLVWGGGIYEWFDPEVLVRAVARLLPRPAAAAAALPGHPPPGARRPDGDRCGARGRRRDRLLDRAVFFHDGWVPYDERGHWLAAADVGVSTHHEHVETEFSFRTRLVDYLWCGLPVVSTGGDDLAEHIAGRAPGWPSRRGIWNPWCWRSGPRSPSGGAPVRPPPPRAEEFAWDRVAGRLRTSALHPPARRTWSSTASTGCSSACAGPGEALWWTGCAPPGARAARGCWSSGPATAWSLGRGECLTDDSGQWTLQDPTTAEPRRWFALARRSGVLPVAG